MLRLRPLFWATFLPGSSTVPAALAVIFRTRSFSSLYTPWLLARPVASLCRKSLRTLASCIRSRDIFPFSLCQLDENLTLRASLCCSFASLSRMPSKALTGSISWPTEVAANRSVSAEANPADLGKLDGAVAFVESLELDVLRRQREGVVLELLSRCRVTAQLLEEAAERVVEVAQGVLQRMDGDEFEPILGSPAHRQFLRLRNVGERESVVAVFVLSPLKGVI